jgi:isoleucyl-tRNA synthetase
VVNDLVLDAEGQKMSKSRGNVVDPWDAIEQFGVDAIRWYFLTASQPWLPKRFDPAALGEAARARSTRWRTRTGSSRCTRTSRSGAVRRDPAAGARKRDGPLDPVAPGHARGGGDADLDGYELTHAGRAIGDFIVDDLSNWYVRRSRDRFWGSGDAADTRAAFRTLHEVLEVLARLLAPFTPFHADWLHRALTAAQRAPGAVPGRAWRAAAARDARWRRACATSASWRASAARRASGCEDPRAPAAGLLQAVVPDASPL